MLCVCHVTHVLNTKALIQSVAKIEMYFPLNWELLFFIWWACASLPSSSRILYPLSFARSQSRNGCDCQEKDVLFSSPTASLFLSIYSILDLIEIIIIIYIHLLNGFHIHCHFRIQFNHPHIRLYTTYKIYIAHKFTNGYLVRVHCRSVLLCLASAPLNIIISFHVISMYMME